MTSSDNQSRELEALQQLLDIYGSDRTRWPAPERLRFAALLAERAEARRLLNEAAALDRVLDLAPVASQSKVQTLAERITAAALDEAQDRPATAASQRPLRVDRAKPWQGYARPARISPQWQVAALLAASLMFGIIIGSGGIAPGAVDPIAEVFGIGGDSVGQLAFDGDTAALSDEDLI